MRQRRDDTADKSVDSHASAIAWRRSALIKRACTRAVRSAGEVFLVQLCRFERSPVRSACSSGPEYASTRRKPAGCRLSGVQSSGGPRRRTAFGGPLTWCSTRSSWTRSHAQPLPHRRFRIDRTTCSRRARAGDGPSRSEVGDRVHQRAGAKVGWGSSRTWRGGHVLSGIARDDTN